MGLGVSRIPAARNDSSRGQHSFAGPIRKGRPCGGYGGVDAKWSARGLEDGGRASDDQPMSASVPLPSQSATQAAPCAGDRVTRSLLGYGIAAGPIYVGASLLEASLRPGFDLTRHSWSLLENGPAGWIHSAVLIISGLCVIAAAVGFRRALGVRAVPVLLALYGAGMVAAGIFTADPADGFPVGTPAGPGHLLARRAHLVSAGVGFLAFTAAAMALGIRFLRSAHRGRGVFAIVTGVLFIGAFVGIASGGAGPTVPAFVGAVVLAWTWLTLTSLDLYRQARSA